MTRLQAIQVAGRICRMKTLGVELPNRAKLLIFHRLALITPMWLHACYHNQNAPATSIDTWVDFDDTEKEPETR